MSRKGTAQTTRVRHDLVAVTLAAAATAITMNANAATDIFAKIGDIKGESTDEKHKGEIEVLSWSWGVVSAKKKGTACGSEMTIEKYVDKATPTLMNNAVRGIFVPSADLFVRRAGASQSDYFVVSMSDVVITSVTSSGAKELDRPIETVTLAYSAATITYIEQLPSGGQGAVIKQPLGAASCAAFGVGGGRFPPS